MKHVNLLPGISLLFLILNNAEAVSTRCTFSGNIDSGILNNKSFSGQFDYDDAGLTHVGYKTLNLATFTLNFLATTFSLSDADSTATATANFLDGKFLGVNFLLDTSNTFKPNFALIPGLFDSSNAYFAYTSSTIPGKDGYGSIVYQCKSTESK